jgi:hypothetical protein
MILILGKKDLYDQCYEFIFEWIIPELELSNKETKRK